MDKRGEMNMTTGMEHDDEYGYGWEYGSPGAYLIMSEEEPKSAEEEFKVVEPKNKKKHWSQVKSKPIGELAYDIKVCKQEHQHNKECCGKKAMLMAVAKEE